MRTKCEARRQAIVNVAREVFQRLGFESASMSQIAARLGGSKATLYNYFNSKEELFVEVAHQFAHDHLSVLFNELDAKKELAPTLKAFGERLLMLICQPDLMANHRNVCAEAGKSEVGRLFYQQGPALGLQRLALYLQECMAAGSLRPADPQLAAMQLIGLLKAEAWDPILFGLRDGLPPEDAGPMVERAIDTFLRAYKVDSCG